MFVRNIRSNLVTALLLVVVVVVVLIFRCDANDDDDIFGYIFGDDQDDLFALPKRLEEEAVAVLEPTEAAPPPPPPAVPAAADAQKKPAAPQPVKKSDDKPAPATLKPEDSPNGDVGFAPLADFLKKSLPELNKSPAPVKLGTEDGGGGGGGGGDDGPLSEFIKFAEQSAASQPQKGRRRKKRRRRRYVLRQLGNKSPPQALMAFGSVVNALSRGVKGLKFAVDGSTNVSAKTVETVGGANNSTIESVQSMVDNTANATRRQINAWADTLDMLRRSMSGSVKKKKDKGHSITITTTSDAPIKSMAAFADKWGNGGGLTGQKPASKPALLPGMVPVEVSDVDFSNFWKK